MSPPPQDNNQHKIMGDAAKIARLEAEVASLRNQLLDSNGPVDIKALAAEAERSRFRPLPATNCLGVKPCLHSTAAERVRAGCVEGVWEGHYGEGTKYKHVEVANISFDQPIAPRDGMRERFAPAIGEQCDLTDVWKLSKLNHDHVTDATERHFHQRLRGLKHALWLSIGSSIDHGWVRETCAAFSAHHTFADAALPTKAYPAPGLIIDFCHLSQLNLTLAHLNGGGIVTMATSRDVDLQAIRFREIDAHLRKVLGFTGPGPTFLSFGGMEWDFKNWRCNFPTTRAEWKVPVAALQMQVQAARAQWPSIRAVFSRTMFQPTYGTFGCSCCANENHFWHYNHLLRQAGKVGGSNGGSTTSMAGGSASRPGLCDSIHTFDLQRIMLCNNSVGSCSSRTGWTADGLHPSRAVYLQYGTLVFNMAADLGEVCRGEEDFVFVPKVQNMVQGGGATGLRGKMFGGRKAL